MVSFPGPLHSGEKWQNYVQLKVLYQPSGFPLIQHLCPVTVWKSIRLFASSLYREMACHNTNSDLMFTGHDHIMRCWRAFDRSFHILFRAELCNQMDRTKLIPDDKAVPAPQWSDSHSTKPESNRISPPAPLNRKGQGAHSSACGRALKGPTHPLQRDADAPTAAVSHLRISKGKYRSKLSPHSQISC